MEHQPDVTQRKPPGFRPLHSFRWSLRTMFVVMTVVSVCVAWVAFERRQSRREFQIVDQLRAGNAVVQIEVVGLFDPLEPSWRKPKREPSWWRRALSGVCGPRVRRIDLHENPLFGDLSPLVGFKSLQALDVRNTQVSDLTALAGLKRLDAVNLDGTPVNDLAPLAGLKNLVVITLGGTHVSDLSPLAALENLDELVLDDTQVSNLAPLAKLKNLQYVYALGIPVSDVSALTALTNLQRLTLNGTQVSEEQVEFLRRNLPNCQIAVGSQTTEGP